MYQLQGSASVDTPSPGRAKLNWQTVERTVLLDFSEVTTPVSFGRYGRHRIAHGRAVLVQHGNSDGWRPELTITLESMDLVEDEILDGVWRWDAPEDSYDEDRNSYWGRIEELPTEIRRPLLDFLRNSDLIEEIDIPSDPSPPSLASDELTGVGYGPEDRSILKPAPQLKDQWVEEIG